MTDPIIQQMQAEALPKVTAPAPVETLIDPEEQRKIEERKKEIASKFKLKTA